jgi:hypothetical protein
MRRKDFEKAVLAVWLRSRVPLSLAHVQHLTGAGRNECKSWLDALTVDGLLDVVVTDDGEMIWSVRGAERPREGAVTIAELERLERLTADVRTGAPRALVRAARSTALAVPHDDHKSVVASGVLSLVLGPMGWLYAAPLREALPGVLLYVLAASLLPHALLMPLIGIIAPLSSGAGIYYAWRHNQTGERTGLFSDKEKEREKKKRSA